LPPGFIRLQRIAAVAAWLACLPAAVTAASDEKADDSHTVRDSLEAGAEKVGDAVKSGAKKVGPAIDRGVEATKKAVEKGADAVGEALEKTGKKIEEKLGSGSDDDKPAKSPSR
jgi:hypothetical protein